MNITAQSHNLVDIIHGVIPYDGLEMSVMESPLFARLHRVYQSSLVYMTYPSNKVHRYEHSLGVMHLSGKFFYHAVRNSDPEDLEQLFEKVITALSDPNCSKLYEYGGNTASDIHDKFKEKCLGFTLDEIPVDTLENSWYSNTLYRDNTPSNISKSRLYYILFESIRLVGLLHDIGHLPYSHIAEHALKELKMEVDPAKADKEKYNKFISVMESCADGSAQIHEVVGRNLVKKIFGRLHDKVNKENIEEDFFLTTVFNTTWAILTDKEGIFLDIHKIVDSSLDCDRMDYTCRDLYCAGVSKEFPRYERMFNTVKIHFAKGPAFKDQNPELIKAREKDGKDREKCLFSFNTKAIGQIEMLLQRRWEDYSNLNYHHSVHKHELLLNKAIVIMGLKYFDEKTNHEEEEKRKKDNKSKENGLPLSISSIWEAIDLARGKGNVDILFSQLDDEWMDTLIRGTFFNDYGDTYYNEFVNHNIKEWNIFDELITGRKHYSSLFKRRGGFSRFDDVFKQVYNEITNDDKTYSDKPFFNTVLVSKIIEAIKNADDSNLSADVNENEKIITKRFYRYANQKMEKWVYLNAAEAKKLNIIDCVLDQNDIAPGIKVQECQETYILSSIPEEKPTSFFEQSLIYKSLENQKKLFPPFHVFYLPRYNTQNSDYEEVDKSALFRVVAKVLVETMLEMNTIIGDLTNSSKPM